MNGAGTVAMTILRQLGGNKFLAMTGAKNLAAGENYLSMTLPRNKSKAHFLKVTLSGDDLYTMSFLYVKSVRPAAILAGAQHSIKTVAEFDRLTWEQLRPTFTEVTGMRTSL